MLNELFDLSRSLKYYSLLQSTTHPNVNNVGKVTCLLIELDKKGVPRETRLLEKEETASLWKHGKGNHNSFPAIRIKKPLLAASESRKISSEEWKYAKSSDKSSYLEALNFEAINVESGHIGISEWTLNEFSRVVHSREPALAALKQLIQVFPHTTEAAEYNKILVTFLRQKMRYTNHEAEIDFLKELLIGSFDEKTKKYVAGCMTYFDVYETNAFDNKVISTETRRALIQLLNDGEASNADTKDIYEPEQSWLSGMNGEIITNKYPNPNIPIIGQTYLYSKGTDTPCLKRYKLSGVQAFKAGKKEILEINDAIAFLTNKSRKNKSWQAMKDSNRDKPNLLLAYMPEDPQNDALLSQILGNPNDYESEIEFVEKSEDAFDALCQQVLGKMESVIRKNPSATINLMMIEPLDAGRKQVVYQNVLTVAQLQRNLNIWTEAASNFENITIPLKSIKNKKEKIKFPPVCPGPDDICQLMKMNYMRSGAMNLMKLSAVSLHDIYRLYMPPVGEAVQEREFLEDILNKVLKKTAQIIGDVAHQLILEHKHMLPPLKKSYFQAKRVALSVSLISILLWRLNVRKEHYMRDTPFNIGQFLKLSDMLHKEYCVQVRNSGKKDKSLPAQLMGNEMLAVAAENPIEGLNRLRDRMRIYLAWANTATGENARLAKWILSRYGEVSAKIADNNLPEHFNATEQAQVLLGYLAAIPYEKKKDKEDEGNE